MAVVSTSRRSAAGIAFIVAGALFLLGVILALASVSFSSWVYVLAALAVAAGLIILALGSVANLIAKIALIAAAVGWFIIALNGATDQIPDGLVVFGAVIAAVGGIVGSIVLYTGKEITDRSAIAFIVTMIIAAIFLLPLIIATFALGATFSVIVTVLLGIGLLITGFLFYKVQRGR